MAGTRSGGIVGSGGPIESGDPFGFPRTPSSRFDRTSGSIVLTVFAIALAVFVVGNRKIAPAQKRNVAGGKITGCDGKAMRQSRVLQLLRLRFTFENERAHSDVSRRGKRCGRCRRFHSGNASDLWHQRGEESAGVFLFELSRRQTNPKGQSARWINSDISRQKF